MPYIGVNQTAIPEVDILISFTTGLLTLIGALGNALVLVAIVTQRNLQKSSNAILFSLAFLDFLTCAFSGPYSIITFYMKGPWPSFAVCRVMLAYGIASSTASCLFIALISINGLCGIVWKQENHTRGRSRVVWLTIFGWLFFLTILVPIPDIIDGVNFEPWLGVCYIEGESETFIYAICIFAITAGSWLVSLLCYLKILNIVRVSRRRVDVVANAPAVERQDARNNHMLKLVVTVFITFVVYIVLFIPLLIVEMLQRSGSNPHYLIYRFACMFLWSSSVFNPYVYAYRLGDFRAGILRLLRPCTKYF